LSQVFRVDDKQIYYLNICASLGQNYSGLIGIYNFEVSEKSNKQKNHSFFQTPQNE